MCQLKEQISEKFGGAQVGDVVVDGFLGCVTATVNGTMFTDCGSIDDFVDGGVWDAELAGWNGRGKTPLRVA